MIPTNRITYKKVVVSQLKQAVAFVRNGKSDENDQREGIKHFARTRKLEILRWENENSPDSPHITGHKTLKYLLVCMDRNGEYMLLIESWERISEHPTVRAQLLEMALRKGVIVTCADGRSTYQAYKRRLETLLIEDLPSPNARISDRALHPENTTIPDLPYGYQISDLGKLSREERKEMLFKRIRQLRGQKKTVKEMLPTLIQEGYKSTTGRTLTRGLVALLASTLAPVGRGRNYRRPEGRKRKKRHQ